MSQKIKIREVLGITQEQASLLVGVSRTHFAMYELGKRDLPTHAMLKLTRLWQFVNENQKNDTLHLLENNKLSLLRFIEEKIEEAQLKKLNWEKKQKKIKNNSIKNQNALQVISFLKREAKSEREEALLQLIENDILIKLKNNNWKEQFELQFKLDSLKLFQEYLIAQKQNLLKGSSEEHSKK